MGHDLKVKMAAMPILFAIGSQGSDTGPIWSSCFEMPLVQSKKHEEALYLWFIKLILKCLSIGTQMEN